MWLLGHLAILTGLLTTPAVSVDSLIDLGYSKYQGKALDNGVTQWLGIRFAAPPVGNLRFTPPEDPYRDDAVQDANKFGLICLATEADVKEIGKTQSEDCLFMNIWAPSNATSASQLPVFVFVQGGGFNSNSNAYVNGTGLVVAGELDMIVVTFNYRVGPYGFLVDGEHVTPNIGLLDQRKALEWVQLYISKFGGNPGHVTLGGDSAGAASVSLHLTAHGGNDTGLFHAVAAESVSFATVLKEEEAVYQYENFAVRLGCVGYGALACLRHKTTEELQKANYNIPYPGGPKPPLYMWNPVVDGDLIPDVTYTLFEEGQFVRVPAIFGDDTNGGTVFTPKNASTLAESNEFLKTQFPFLTLGQLGKINELYPNKNKTCPSPGCYWRQVSDAYGQMRYMCPGLYISSALTRYNVSQSWNYRYNVEDPQDMASGIGVPHTVEIHAIFGPGHGGGDAPASYLKGEINAPVTSVVQGYWTSFIRTYNPNTHRREGSVKWGAWRDERKQRILFDTGGETRMEVVGRELEGRCEFFAGIGAEIRQ